MSTESNLSFGFPFCWSRQQRVCETSDTMARANRRLDALTAGINDDARLMCNTSGVGYERSSENPPSQAHFDVQVRNAAPNIASVQ